MAAASGPVAATSGLILHLDPGNPKCYSGSGTNMLDLSYSGNNGTLVNGPTYGTNNSGVIVTDGLNDYISIASPANNSLSWTSSGIGNNSMSIELWVKTSDAGSYQISKPWNGNGEYNYRITDSFALFRVSTSAAIYFTSTATGRWEHLSIVINPTQFAAYRNGTINSGFTNHGLTVNTTDFGNANLPLALMTLYPYGSGWPGRTDFSSLGDSSIFRLYNRVLTPDEILQNYNAVKGRFGY
jgi:hypothetical protein